MLSNEKFKPLDELKKHPDFQGKIPNYFSVPLCSVELYKFKELFFGDKKYILRSCLRGEAGDRLEPGRSITINNIMSFADLFRAHKEIIGQVGLSEIILQEQIEYDKHLTGLYKEGLLYFENTFNSNEFGYLTNRTSFGTLELPSELLSVCKGAQNKLNFKTTLFEIGLKEGQSYIFQAVKVKEEKVLDSMFQNYRVREVVNYEKALKGFRFMFELKRAWQAFRLRRQFSSAHPKPKSYGDVVLNWEAIVHFYKVYVWLKGRARFIDFYSWATCEKSKLARLANTHFKIAYGLAGGKFIPPDFVENYEHHIFLGEKNQLAEIGQNAFLLEELLPKDVYELPPGSLILTKSNHLLSHGYLAAIEQGHSLVGNIREHQWGQLASGQKLQVDFAHEKIEVLEGP